MAYQKWKIPISFIPIPRLHLQIFLNFPPSFLHYVKGVQIRSFFLVRIWTHLTQCLPKWSRQLVSISKSFQHTGHYQEKQMVFTLHHLLWVVQDFESGNFSEHGYTRLHFTRLLNICFICEHLVVIITKWKDQDWYLHECQEQDCDSLFLLWVYFTKTFWPPSQTRYVFNKCSVAVKKIKLEPTM